MAVDRPHGGCGFTRQCSDGWKPPQLLLLTLYKALECILYYRTDGCGFQHKRTQFWFKEAQKFDSRFSNSTLKELTTFLKMKWSNKYTSKGKYHLYLPIFFPFFKSSFFPYFDVTIVIYGKFCFILIALALPSQS